MITYHQAFDVYHTSFRIIYFLSTNEIDEIEVERLRIFDFLLLFPHELHNVSMPIGTGSIKSKFKENKYNRVPNRRRVFFQLGKHYELAIKCLISYNLIKIDNYKNGFLSLNQNTITEKIINGYYNSIDSELIKLLKQEFMPLSLYELKKRTKLIEYKYDLPNT